jgi:curved DNA-binding protein CbpA
MSLNWIEAMTILGLTFKESLDIHAIRRAWKIHIMKVHPDKNQLSGDDATRQTQRINEAKDTLIARIKEQGQDSYAAEEERLARERKVQAEDKARQQAKDKARQQERQAAWDQECAALQKRMKEAQKERYLKNRRKRAPEARVHRKIEDYKEGLDLVKEMKIFFQDNFMNDTCTKILVNDILDLFIKSRSQTSELEKNLFKRHSKRIFMAVWSNARCSTLKNKFCYMYVAIKK